MLLTEKKYNPALIESTAQLYWERQKLFEKKEDKRDKFYCVSMLPYPSGDLHMGHIRNYTIGDVITRYKTMCGKNVMQPIGWDAFGLPAENAAMKNKIHPERWTKQNISNMRKQLKLLGYAFDWKREITTCDPSYYKWEQWLFLKLYKRNMAYRKKSLVNWDPVDKTVLANEQVIEGKGWRSGALVEKKEINQWFLKITQYSEELLSELDVLDGWPQHVKQMQKNWIGKYQETRIDFELCGSREKIPVRLRELELIFGVTCLYITQNSNLIKDVCFTNEILQALKRYEFIGGTRKNHVKEKILVNTGLSAINPISKKIIPIYIANFLHEVSSDLAIASVPAHNILDHALAKKYNLSILPIIRGDSVWDFNRAPYMGQGYSVNSGKYNGICSNKLRDIVLSDILNNKCGHTVTSYKLRDWIISRQRNWGTPVPIIYCDICGVLPVPEKDLPIILPYDREEKDINIKCYICQGDAKRETDTMDTFVESSWYYLRYCSPDQDSSISDSRANYWMPVDQYIGGREHSIMHLLYARFLYKVLRDESIVNGNEPFKNLLTQGMVLKDGEKMSKSKGNCVSPQPLLNQYGADTLRFFMIFSAPPEQNLEWSEGSIIGSYRFLNKVWDFSIKKQEFIKNSTGLTKTLAKTESLDEDTKKILIDFNHVLKKANEDVKNMRLNTLASAAMKMFNLVEKSEKKQLDLIASMFSIFLRLLHPISPHITQIIWKNLGYGDNILLGKWPEQGFDIIAQGRVEIGVQINGKMRGRIKISVDDQENDIVYLVSKNEKFCSFFSGKIVKKVFLIEKKLISILLI